MAKFVCLKFWAFILGLATFPLSIKDTSATTTNFNSSAMNQPSSEKNILFIEPYLDDSSSFQLAGHRSHRSHSSHRSHYSSRGGYGGSYYRSTPTYSAPVRANPSTVYPATNTQNRVSSSPSAITSSANVNSLILEIQIKLKQLDFFEGTPDGIYGKKTRNAIILYQIDKGLTPDGQATQELLNHINKHIK